MLEQIKNMTTPNDIMKSEKKNVAKLLKGSRDPYKVKKSLLKFYASLDNNMRNVASAYHLPLECREGCSYCCLLKVDAKAHEIFSIVDYIDDTFTANEKEALIHRLHESADEISPLTAQEHLVSNIPCGLLVNDSCTVYPVRPSLCRKFHSTSQANCIDSYERPTDNSVPSSEDRDLDMAARAAIIGYDEGLKKSKLDVAVYEINKALLYALSDPSYKQAWRKGNKTFPDDAEAKH